MTTKSKECVVCGVLRAYEKDVNSSERRPVALTDKQIAGIALFGVAAALTSIADGNYAAAMASTLVPVDFVRDYPDAFADEELDTVKLALSNIKPRLIDYIKSFNTARDADKINTPTGNGLDD